MLCLKLPNHMYPHVISVGCFSTHCTSAVHSTVFHCHASISWGCCAMLERRLGQPTAFGLEPSNRVWSILSYWSSSHHPSLDIFGNRGYYRRLEQAPPVIHPVARLVDSCCWSFATSPCVVWYGLMQWENCGFDSTRWAWSKSRPSNRIQPLH